MHIKQALKQLSEVAKKHISKPTLGAFNNELFLMLTKEEARKAEWIPKDIGGFNVVIRIMGTIIAA